MTLIARGEDGENLPASLDEALRLILSRAPLVLFLQDIDLRYRWYSAPFDLSGHQTPPPHLVVGHKDHDLFAADVAQEMERVKRIVIETGGAMRTEVRMGDLFLDLCLEPVRDRGGAVCGVMGVAIDVSPREAARRALEAALAERDEALAKLAMLKREADHRIKNNLQLVRAGITLHMKEVTDLAALGALRDAGERVGTVARLHEKLQDAGDIASVNLADYVTAICADVAASVSGQRVTVRTRCDAVDSPPETALRIGLLLTELILNAVKHGRAEDQSEVEVMLDCEESALVLTIADNGPGLPQGFVLGETGGLGSRLVGDLIRQVQGGSAIRSSDRGTIIRIDMPLPRQRASLSQPG